MNELRNFISENNIPITESKFREMEKLIKERMKADKAELLEVLEECNNTYEIQTDYFKNMDVAKGVITGSWLRTPAKIKNIIKQASGE